jgi:hypothetical protein
MLSEMQEVIQNRIYDMPFIRTNKRLIEGWRRAAEDWATEYTAADG